MFYSCTCETVQLRGKRAMLNINCSLSSLCLVESRLSSFWMCLQSTEVTPHQLTFFEDTRMCFSELRVCGCIASGLVHLNLASPLLTLKSFRLKKQHANSKLECLFDLTGKRESNRGLYPLGFFSMYTRTSKDGE